MVSKLSKKYNDLKDMFYLKDLKGCKLHLVQRVGYKTVNVAADC